MLKLNASLIRLAILFAFLTLLFCVANSQSDRQGNDIGFTRIPSSWRKLDTGPFSILAPAGWKFRQLEGVDSYVGEFVGQNITLTFDFGRYSDGYFKKPKQSAFVFRESINGHPAKLVKPRPQEHGVTSVYFGRVRGRNSLYVWGKNLDDSHEQLVWRMFHTIRFGGPMPSSFIPPPPLPPPSQNSRTH